MLPKITHAELPSFIKLSIETGENLLIVGKPGIGKTKGVFDFAKAYDYTVELAHPAVEDPTNRQGFPSKATRTVVEEPDELDAMLGNTETKTYQEDYATFLYFGQQLRLMHAKKPTILMADDFGQAPGAVQAGWMQLLGSRQLNESRLPDCVHIIAATNSREDKAGVKGLLEPVKSRFGIIVELVADLDSFRDFAYAKGLPHVLTDYLNFTPGALHEWNPNIGMENSPCPRLWEKLGKYMNNLKDCENQAFIEKVCSSAIGEKHGSRFAAFCKLYKSIPRYEEIIADPDNFEINHSLDVRYAIIGLLANMGKENHSDKVFQIIRKFAKEYQVVFMRTISALKSPLINTLEAKTWCAENATIYLAALQRGNTAF